MFIVILTQSLFWQIKPAISVLELYCSYVLVLQRPVVNKRWPTIVFMSELVNVVLCFILHYICSIGSFVRFCLVFVKKLVGCS